MVLKWRAVFDGQQPLMSSADRLISEAVMGQRGCTAIFLVGSAMGAVVTCSADILLLYAKSFLYICGEKIEETRVVDAKIYNDDKSS